MAQPDRFDIAAQLAVMERATKAQERIADSLERIALILRDWFTEWSHKS